MRIRTRKKYAFKAQLSSRETVDFEMSGILEPTDAIVVTDNVTPATYDQPSEDTGMEQMDDQVDDWLRELDHDLDDMIGKELPFPSPYTGKIVITEIDDISADDDLEYDHDWREKEITYNGFKFDSVYITAQVQSDDATDQQLQDDNAEFDELMNILAEQLQTILRTTLSVHSDAQKVKVMWNS